MNGIETIRARLAARYALDLYLPASRAARRLRETSRALRGKRSVATRLEQAEWRGLLPRRSIRLADTGKRSGNVNVAELAILAQAAAATEPGRTIVEIGTFDGRTTLNLAINAPADCPILTLDLPDEHETAFPLEDSERPLVQKPASGERFRACASAWRSFAARITQAFGDSATYDWTPCYGRAGLVFVDGSHAYDYVRKDSETAFDLVASGGVVLWHDYGVWPGVTRALEEFEALRRLGLRHIRGTSLVLWRAPARVTPHTVAGQDGAEPLHVAAPAATALDGTPPFLPRE